MQKEFWADTFRDPCKFTYVGLVANYHKTPLKDLRWINIAPCLRRAS